MNISVETIYYKYIKTETDKKIGIIFYLEIIVIVRKLYQILNNNLIVLMRCYTKMICNTTWLNYKNKRNIEF